MSKTVRVLVTGANGFIGKNLVVRLRELSRYTITEFLRGDELETLPSLVAHADAVVHLAGENRPADEAAFTQVNTGLTVAVCNAVADVQRISGRQVSLILASSAQAECDNLYGQSKLAAEHVVQALCKDTDCPAVVYRLPGVFGKWCKPNYNSVVATFCHNIARGLPLQVNDPLASLQLVYVDDVVLSFISELDAPVPGFVRREVAPIYTTSLGALAAQLEAFWDCRTSLIGERVGAGFTRALYATYVSYLPNENFAYAIPVHSDPRGVFVEMLKTHDSGQFSYFTVHPGLTRGGHYHHTKTEKFLVIRGQAVFRFRHLLTGELFELTTSGDKPEVVDTVPGWVHAITNVGNDEMVVMLWANEVFDRNQPDTVAGKF